MREHDIWGAAYRMAKIDILNDNQAMFSKDILRCLADNIDKEVHPKSIDSIFTDCYRLLESQIDKPNWIAINETVDKLVNSKYAGNENEKMLCASLVSVIVNHLGRMGDKEGWLK